MTVPVGGLRSRFVRESLYHRLYDGLAAIGWFNAGRQHQTVHFVSAPIDDQHEIPFNTVALTDGNLDTTEAEIGSLLAEHRWTMYVDIYAENNALGMQLAYDLKSLLEGRMPSIGYNDPSFAVYDYTHATPSLFAYCQVENVMVDRAQGFPEAWRRWWYSVALTVIDTYADDADDADDVLEGDGLIGVVDGGTP